jgi:hypothetical protein
VLDLVLHRGDSSVELFLDVLDDQVPDEQPGQRTREQQADDDDAGSSRQEAEAEGQLAPSSSR